jgi:hypothetical protein
MGHVGSTLFQSLFRQCPIISLNKDLSIERVGNIIEEDLSEETIPHTFLGQ